jgi:hypothetical protein
MADDKKNKSAGNKKGADKGGAKPAAGPKGGGPPPAKAPKVAKKAAPTELTEAERAQRAERAKETMAPRLREKYRAEVVPALMKQFKYGNHMQVPRVVKRSRTPRSSRRASSR